MSLDSNIQTDKVYSSLTVTQKLVTGKTVAPRIFASQARVGDLITDSLIIAGEAFVAESFLTTEPPLTGQGTDEDPLTYTLVAMEPLHQTRFQGDLIAGVYIEQNGSFSPVITPDTQVFSAVNPLKAIMVRADQVVESKGGNDVGDFSVEVEDLTGTTIPGSKTSVANLPMGGTAGNAIWTFTDPIAPFTKFILKVQTTIGGFFVDPDFRLHIVGILND